MFGHDDSLYVHTCLYSRKDAEKDTKEETMIPPEKIKELRKRMREHTTVKDMAVVVLTARELQELLDVVEGIQRDTATGEKL